jgi:hypothetical protein
MNWNLLKNIEQNIYNLLVKLIFSEKFVFFCTILDQSGMLDLKWRDKIGQSHSEMSHHVTEALSGVQPPTTETIPAE